MWYACVADNGRCKMSVCGWMGKINARIFVDREVMLVSVLTEESCTGMVVRGNNHVGGKAKEVSECCGSGNGSKSARDL